MKKTVVLKIMGMTCESCASRVRRMLEKEAGVVNADVSLRGSTATVHFNPSQITIDGILNSKAFNRTFVTKGNDGRRITHRYSVVPLNRRESVPERSLEGDFA